MKKQTIAWKLPVIAMLLAAMALITVGCSSQTTDEAADATDEATEAVAPEEDAAAEATQAAPAEEPAAAEEAVEPEVVSGTVTTTVDMTGYDEGATVRVWIPVAQDGEYQTITDAGVEAETADVAEITTDAQGNKMAYIEWGADADPATRIATSSFHAARTEALVRDMVEEGEIPSDIAEKYLGSSEMVDVDDPEVVALAEEITAGQDTVLGKAQAIYDWIYENMNRDNDVTGCGDGDVCRLIQPDVRVGKCTDIGSVFVALCRASGVPAREMFGVRMNDPDITSNQHCWVEFYLPGTGWVPCDPADVLKAVLNDELDKSSEEALAKKDYYWGGWDAKRVELSQERDLTLEPAQAAGPLNDFGYPYAEVNDEAVDFYSPDTFVYTISFEED